MGRIRKLALSGAVAFYFTVNPGVLFAQSDDNAIVIGHRHEVHSAVLGEDRPILVHTPAGYDESTAGYPVMYLLDGQGSLPPHVRCGGVLGGKQPHACDDRGCDSQHC